MKMNPYLRRRHSFPLFLIPFYFAVLEDSEATAIQNGRVKLDASNVTRIPVETNASFAPPRTTSETNSRSSVEGGDISLPTMTRVSIDNDITYGNNNNTSDVLFADSKMYIVYNSKKREGDVLNRSVVSYNNNESLFLYNDHNGSRDGDSDSDFDFAPPRNTSYFTGRESSTRTKPTVVVPRKGNAKVEATKTKKRTKLKKNKDRRKKRKGKKAKAKSKDNKNKATPTPKHGTKTKATSSSSSKIRLPSSVIPVHYVLRLRPRFEEDFLVEGSVEIEVEVRTATPRIKLHSSKISVNKTSVKVNLFKTHKIVPVKNIKFNPRRQFMTVKLRRKLRPGRVYVLSMKFQYHLNEEANGFYKASFVNEFGDIAWLAATQFWPSDARKAFPCFDEPRLKATFDVHLAHSEDKTSLSNMPLVRSYKTKEEPGWVWDQFATSVNMSTYLLAFAVTDFTFASSEKRNETLIRAWTRKTMQNRTSLALRVGSSSLKFFESYFDLPFPLPKMDMIALPKLSFNGMENWGLITFKESSLLLDVSSTSVAHSLSVSKLIAHEVAHQWFGNLVTFEWWNDLWLNEGFATYMSFLAIDNAEPSWKVLDQFVVTRLQEVMAVDAFPSSHPVSSPIKDPSKINDIFDSIPYNKGASIIRMMKHFLSEATFRKGIRGYLKHFQYKNTRQNDLWEFMTKASQKDKSLPVGVSVKGIMDTWTLQPGYPLLQVERLNNGTAFLTQKSFRLRKMTSKQKKGQQGYKWWIPITFTTQRSPSFKHTRAQTWLRQEDDSLKVTGLPPSDQWVIFNLQQTGYYRVNYDQATWYLLINQLNTNHEVIHVTNRAQLIDDSLNLARAGLLPYDLALQLVSYLKYETEYIPWSAGLRNLNYIKEMLQKTQDYGMFKAFLMDLLDPLIKHVGLEPRDNDTMHVNLMRLEVVSWICRLEHHFCQSKARNMTLNLDSNFSEFNLSKFDASFSDYVLCSAVRNGDETFWEKIWHLYLNSRTIDKKSKYLAALGCTRYVWLLSRYMQLLEDPSSGVLRQDGAQLYKAATQTPIGVYVAWDTFRTSWPKMKNFSDFTFYVAPRIIDVITNSFNTQHHLKELLAFREKVRHENSHMKSTFKATNKASPVLPALNNAVSKVEVNLKWMRDNHATITNWFLTHGLDNRQNSSLRRRKRRISEIDLP